MYCKKCGQQLSEGAAFCGNCGTPAGTQNQIASAGIGRNAGASRNAAIFKTIEAEQKGKKKGGKKIPVILLSCLLLFITIGAGVYFFGNQLNENDTEAVVAEKEAEKETEETSEEKKDREADEKEDADIMEIQQEASAEALPEMENIEPLYHEEEEEGIHTYELIVDDVTWTEACAACTARGGHLVRIGSQEEYQAILQQINEENKGNIKFWLGGARSAADVYEYRWIYEDGTYGSIVLNEEDSFLSYWLSGEPSFYDESILQDEMYMNMFYVSTEERWVWNDVPDDLIAAAEFYSGTVGYICEYEN